MSTRSLGTSRATTAYGPVNGPITVLARCSRRGRVRRGTPWYGRSTVTVLSSWACVPRIIAWSTIRRTLACLSLCGVGRSTRLRRGAGVLSILTCVPWIVARDVGHWLCALTCLGSCGTGGSAGLRRGAQVTVVISCGRSCGRRRALQG